MKVHELAKENGFTASKFMEEIRKFGIDKKHHMNVLSGEEVDLIRKKLQKGVQNQSQSDGSKTENLNRNEEKTAMLNIVKLMKIKILMKITKNLNNHWKKILS